MKKFAVVIIFFAVSMTNVVLGSPSGKVNEFVGISDPQVKQYSVSTSEEPALTNKQIVDLLRSKVKYVYVFEQGGHSFDSLFGTFPGALGLYSQPASQTRGFYQVVINTDDSHASVRPFRIGRAEYAAHTDELDHSNAGLIAKLNVYKGTPLLDKYVIAEEQKHSPDGNPTLQAKQFGELTMAYVDGDTVPFLWRYANRFVLFDHIFQNIKETPMPQKDGVFYRKNGGRNNLGLKPANPDPAVQAAFSDDGNSLTLDAQIEEADLAEAINKIASSRYWRQCAIIIAWDGSGGHFDNVPPPVIKTGSNSANKSDGPRVPLLVISPWAKAHSIVHSSGNHASIGKFVDLLFSKNTHSGKINISNEGISALTAAFDPARLAGRSAPLPAWYAEIPENLIKTLPQKSGYGWRQVGVVPTDYTRHITNMIPPDFNPRPMTNPTDSASISK